MKFASRKDILFIIIIIGICTFLIGLTIIGIINGEMKPNEWWIVTPIIGTAGFLLWLLFDTKYELTKTNFIYKSGPVYGKIKIDQIREIVKDKTLWVGF